MLFSSAAFLYSFLPLTIAVYFLMPRRLKNAALLLMSLIFYAWGEPRYVVLMVLSITQGYIFARLIGKSRGTKKAKAYLIISLVLSLGMLGVFKYANFFAESFAAVFGLKIAALNIALPIGISFYTFQLISYVIDVYRADVEPQRDYVAFAAYISMFPQLIAGPIVRYSDVAAEIKQRTVTTEDIAAGLRRFCFGMGKKVLIANTLAYTADKVFALDSAAINAPIAWLGAVCYLMQIYFDFSGYSDMAIGLGRAFGFTFRENFMYPYCAASMQDFWRKWHISLSTWFKEYVYIPLGGNRRGKLRTGLNKLIVFLLTGLWHGASWNFAVWGLYHGAFLMAESYGALKPNRWPKALRHIYTVIAVTVGFVIFRAETLGQAWLIISKMFTGWTFDTALGAQLSLLLSPLCSAALIASVFACMPYASSIASRYTANRPRFGYAVYLAAFALFVVCIACLSTASYNPFIYFRF